MISPHNVCTGFGGGSVYQKIVYYEDVPDREHFYSTSTGNEYRKGEYYEGETFEAKTLVYQDEYQHAIRSRDISGLKKMVLPVIRRVVNKPTANEIVGVQNMSRKIDD